MGALFNIKEMLIMKVTLNIAGKAKEYQTPYISGLVYRQYMLLSEKVDYLKEAPTVEQMDDLIALIVTAFNNQFTVDEFYAGLPIEVLREKMVEFVFRVMGVPINEELDEETKENFEEDATPRNGDE
jgi:hypothetical protein